ncbi:cytoplasmic dynein 2 intermediate chain 1 isoform X2 [Dermacentor silvarum]|uniref:cytoplasmic dynein 2 intermediate chain 1 isoform X2 n=1 Tax=Dermacentor silvarum TaxID=543639 RepID=UPI002100E11F|nr:cytoplasmic dynein 2 intermediate chain 1 isoform X2 [Dermacentor silvarum]
MCAEQALASWGDLQPLRSKMSQKTRPTGPRANGTQAKVPETRRKSTADDGGSKARSVSRDNRAPNRRESVKPTAQNATKRSSSQHESRKVPVPPETKKPPPGQRDARSTSRQPDSRKSTTQPDAKAAAPSRHDSKAITANTKLSSRTTVPKNKDSLASRVSTTGVRSPSRLGKETAEPSARRHSRNSEKERESEKVVTATSSSGASEKRPKETHRTKTAKSLQVPPGGSAEAKHGDETESKGSSPTTSRKKQSSHVSKAEKPDHQERKSPYAKGGTSHKTSKARPQKDAASEKEDTQPPTPTASASKKSRTVTRQATYSAEQLQQAGSMETARGVEVAMETEQRIGNARASTSHSTEKVMPESSKSETSRTRHSSVADDGYSYDDDFEDYESDFENDDAVDDESSVSSAVSDSNSSDSAPATGNDNVTSRKDPVLPENDKLTTQEYSEVSSEKLKQQSHWKSEPVLEVDAKPPAPLMPTSFSTYSLVSYLTAQKKEENKKVLSKAQQRAKDVLEMVSLDTMTYQVFDVPPITYDVYISTFGRADAKQVLVQTDLGDEEECQTENIELEEKWTQQPPHDYKGFGGGNADGKPVDSDAQHLQSGEDVMNLLDFLKNSSDLMLRVIDEDLACKTRRNLKRASEVDGFSGGFLRLDPLPFAKGSPINFVRFSRPCPNYLVTGHDLTSMPDEVRESVPGDTVLCVWNLNSPATPTDVLITNCQVTCCHWSPLDAVSLATGSLDGSVELWDLRDKFCLSKNVVVNEGCPECQEYSMKMPVYSTASLFDKDCHFAKIVDICCWAQGEMAGSSDFVKQHRATQSPSEGGYNVWSLDEEGTLVSWAVAAVKSEPEGSLSDLGLAPGAVLRLVRAAVFRVPNFLPPSYEEARNGLRTFGAARLGATRVLVTTDIGVVVHLDLYNARTSPKVFSSKKKPWSAQECYIALSPHHPSFFLVASRNGALRLHFLEYELAVWEWGPLERTELGALLWSPCTPTQFYVTTAAGEVATWDLSTSRDGPTGVARFPSSRVLAMDADSALTSRTFESCLALAMDDGVAQVHLMGPADNSQLNRDQIQEKLLSL